MKFSDWMAEPNPDGSKKRKGQVARKIGVHQTMVTLYAEGRAIPSPKVMANIYRETGGRVTPTEFYDLPVGADAPQTRARV